ncbi:MAG TPA: hypothetical protein VF432_07855 [Thermoanaerobaculia bacterium]
MKATATVKQWWMLLVFLLLAGCRGERVADTATIAPAKPRPATTQTATLNDRPMITTSGSPVPADALAPGTQFVMLDRAGISMRELIPRGHTVFHITNETAAPHDLVLRGAAGIAVPAALPAAGRSVLQARLTERTYALVCVTPGHAERAEFSTYVPGPGPLR